MTIAAEESTERQPITGQDTEPRVKNEPMMEQSDLSPASGDQEEGVVTPEQGQGKKIAFHRLQDLLSSV